MFDVLADRQINLLAVSSSEIKVSALIAEDQLDLAVRALHTAFGLDAEQAACARRSTTGPSATPSQSVDLWRLTLSPQPSNRDLSSGEMKARDGR